jgi:hypothetical protein
LQRQNRNRLQLRGTSAGDLSQPVRLDDEDPFPPEPDDTLLLPRAEDPTDGEVRDARHLGYIVPRDWGRDLNAL